jgi:hypothetical protein
MRNDVGFAGEADEEELVAEALNARGIWRRLRLRAEPPNRRAQRKSRRASQCGLN